MSWLLVSITAECKREDSRRRRFQFTLRQLSTVIRGNPRLRRPVRGGPSRAGTSARSRRDGAQHQTKPGTKPRNTELKRQTVRIAQTGELARPRREGIRIPGSTGRAYPRRREFPPVPTSTDPSPGDDFPARSAGRQVPVRTYYVCSDLGSRESGLRKPSGHCGNGYNPISRGKKRRDCGSPPLAPLLGTRAAAHIMA